MFSFLKYHDVVLVGKNVVIKVDIISSEKNIRDP